MTTDYIDIPPSLNPTGSFLETDKSVQKELAKYVKKYHKVFDVDEFESPLKGDVAESIFLSSFKKNGYDIIRKPKNSPGADYVLCKNGKVERISQKSGSITKIKESGDKHLLVSSYRLAGEDIGTTLEEKVAYVKARELDIDFYYFLIERSECKMYQLACTRKFFNYDDCVWSDGDVPSCFAKAVDSDGSISKMSGKSQSYMLWVSKPVRLISVVDNLEMYE